MTSCVFSLTFVGTRGNHPPPLPPCSLLCCCVPVVLHHVFAGNGTHDGRGMPRRKLDRLSRPARAYLGQVGEERIPASAPWCQAVSSSVTLSFRRTSTQQREHHEPIERLFFDVGALFIVHPSRGASRCGCCCAMARRGVAGTTRRLYSFWLPCSGLCFVCISPPLHVL